jgi:hypothetical protein
MQVARPICIMGQHYMFMELQCAKHYQLYVITKEKIYLQTWLLWAMWLKRGKENSYNMLPFLAFETRSSSIDFDFEATKYYTKTLGFITTFVVTCASHDYMIM